MIGLGISLWQVAVRGGGSSPASSPEIEIMQRDGALVLTRAGDQVIARES